jgi:hypothetical protein
MLIKNVKFQEDSNSIHSIYINDEEIIECIDYSNKDGEVIDAKGLLSTSSTTSSVVVLDE